MSIRVRPRGPRLHWFPAVAVPLAGGATGLLAVRQPVLALMAATGVLFVAVVSRSVQSGTVVFTLLTFAPGLPAGASVTKAAGAVLGFAWLAVMLRSRRALGAWQAHPLVAWSAVLLCGWALMSAAWAEDPAVALGTTAQLAVGVMLFAIIRSVVTDRRAFRDLVVAFTVGAAVTCAAGLVTVLRHGFGAAGATRFAGGLGDPNELAAVLVPALALGFFALPTLATRRSRLAVAGCLFSSLLGLVMTQSRGGLVGGCVMLAVGIVAGGPLRARLALCAALAVTVAGAYFAVGSVDRVASGKDSGRIALWATAWDIAADHPVLGVGAGNFRTVAPRYTAETTRDVDPVPVVVHRSVVHNSFLEIQAELGAPGLMLFLGVITGSAGTAWRSARRARRSGDRHGELLARGVLVGTVGFLGALVFLSGAYYVHLWLLLGLAAATDSTGQRERCPSAASVAASSRNRSSREGTASA